MQTAPLTSLFFMPDLPLLGLYCDAADAALSRAITAAIQTYHFFLPPWVFCRTGAYLFLSFLTTQRLPYICACTQVHCAMPTRPTYGLQCTSCT